MYAPMRTIFLADQKTPAMDKLFYFVFQTDYMLPKFLNDEEYHGKNLLAPCVKNILKHTKDSDSVDVDSDDEYDEQYEEEVSYVCSYH